jgi:hypothetical protein
VTLRRVWLVTFVVVLGCGQAAVGMRASRTATVTGDEPFYLATAQSLVSDGDLDLRDEYASLGQREFDRFWDGSVPLWRQMKPAEDGRLLAPHEPGLPLLIAPAYAVGGLDGVRRFLVVVWAVGMAFAAVVVRRVLDGSASVGGGGGNRGGDRGGNGVGNGVGNGGGDGRALAWLAIGAAVVVGAGVPGLVYASQVYPEGAAACCVAAALALLASSKARPVALALVLVALAWLGVKYVPLAALLAAFWARSRPHLASSAPKARRWWPEAVAGVIVAVAAAHYVWWHMHTFGGLTPYGANVVWAGEGTASILADHLDLTDRTYRLYGLFLDARFGLFVWLPAAVLAVAGVERRTARYAAALAVCVLMGTFASITMMGWWFPGRMLVAALPALAVLLAVGARRVPRWVAIALGAWSLAIAAAVAWGAHHRWIRLAVDPFVLGAPLPPRWLFPDFRQFGVAEVAVSLGWLAAAAVLVSVARWRPSCSWTGTPLRTGRSSLSRPRWRPLRGR